jgi:hypothetical protein
MKTTLVLCILIAAAIVLIPGCDRSGYPSETNATQTSPFGGFRSATAVSLLPQSVVLEGFTVTYDGRTLANNQTKFSYTVTGPDVDLHFRLELPGCAPALAGSSSPPNGVSSNNDPDINPGITWHIPNGVSAADTVHFYVLYPGTVREGIVLTSVNTNSGTQVGRIAGACARVFNISGAAFTDANSNGLRDATETGIPNSTVNLYDTTNTLIRSMVTDVNGNYLFESIPDGTYRVAVDTGTIASTSTTYLIRTTASSYIVIGEPDQTNNNFGYAPNSKKLINDLKFGILPTTGFTPGFWKKQLASAISGSGNPTFTKAALIGYIATIRTLLLTDPFQTSLGTGDGLQAAYNILNKPIKTDLDALTQQLLALEFNWASNHGIQATDAALQYQLMGWGEALVAANSTVPAPATMSILPGATTSSLLTDATTTISGVNKSSGGGGTQ